MENFKTIPKGFCAIIFFLVISISCYSQDSIANINPPGVYGVLKAQRSFIFIDVTQNTWFDLPDDVKTKFIGGGFNFSLFYEIPLVKNVLGFAPGIGFSNATVKANVFVSYNQPPDSTLLIPYRDTIENMKTKISTSYFDIPVEFRIRIKPDQRGKNFWFAPGFRAGFLLSDFWKFKGDDLLGNPLKLKEYEIANLQKFRYGVSFRAGYYKFGVYAFYSLSTLFEKDKGPGITPFSGGITFTPF